MGLVRKRADLVDEVRLVSHQSEQLIDAERARTLGDTCRLRRILASFVRGLLDETPALLKRKPPNRRQNLVDAAPSRTP